MKRLAALTLLLALPFSVGCPEPPKLAQMDDMIAGLSHLKDWDTYMMGKGSLSFDSVMGYGPDIYPVLVDHLTDESPTAIYDEVSGRNPKVNDLIFLMLLELMKLQWQDFAKDGVFVSTALANPVFSIKWDRKVKLKVQHHFRFILDNPEEAMKELELEREKAEKRLKK